MILYFICYGEMPDFNLVFSPLFSDGLIAQGIEQPPSKRSVVGSIPTQSVSFTNNPKALKPKVEIVE
jgi:hypothetical protein